MMRAHKGGSSVVDVYIKSIAETKVRLAMGMSAKGGYPLKFSMEPE